MPAALLCVFSRVGANVLSAPPLRAESAKREANLISKEVGRKKKAGEDTEAEQEQVRKLKVTIAELEDKAKVRRWDEMGCVAGCECYGY